MLGVERLEPPRERAAAGRPRSLPVRGAIDRPRELGAMVRRRVTSQRVLSRARGSTPGAATTKLSTWEAQFGKTQLTGTPPELGTPTCETLSRPFFEVALARF